MAEPEDGLRSRMARMSRLRAQQQAQLLQVLSRQIGYDIEIDPVLREQFGISIEAVRLQPAGERAHRNFPLGSTTAFDAPVGLLRPAECGATFLWYDLSCCGKTFDLDLVSVRQGLPDEFVLRCTNCNNTRKYAPSDQHPVLFVGWEDAQA